MTLSREEYLDEISLVRNKDKKVRVRADYSPSRDGLAEGGPFYIYIHPILITDPEEDTLGWGQQAGTNNNKWTLRPQKDGFSDNGYSGGNIEAFRWALCKLCPEILLADIRRLIPNGGIRHVDGLSIDIDPDRLEIRVLESGIWVPLMDFISIFRKSEYNMFEEINLGVVHDDIRADQRHRQNESDRLKGRFLLMDSIYEDEPDLADFAKRVLNRD